jgi:hypothetical protein
MQWKYSKGTEKKTRGIWSYIALFLHATTDGFAK